MADPEKPDNTTPPNGVHVEAIEPEQTEIIAKPCCARLGNQAWCTKLDGHEGDHDGPTPTYGPIEERPKLWRDMKGMSDNVERVSSGTVDSANAIVTIVKLRSK